MQALREQLGDDGAIAQIARVNNALGSKVLSLQAERDDLRDLLAEAKVMLETNITSISDWAELYHLLARIDAKLGEGKP